MFGAAITSSSEATGKNSQLASAVFVPTRPISQVLSATLFITSRLSEQLVRNRISGAFSWYAASSSGSRYSDGTDDTPICSIRDLILMKNFDLISIIAALFAVMVVYNVANGSFHLGFSGQPIAHSQHLWNILGMYVVGFAAVLAGGCPLRQLILAGQGSSDSAVTFLGMLIGAAFAHNFGLVGAAAKAATETEPAVAGGPAAAGKIAVIVCIVVLFVIAGTNLRRKKTAK